MSAANRRRALAAAAVFAVLLGGVAMVVVIVRGVGALSAEIESFTAPGRLVIEDAEPGRYTVFLEGRGGMRSSARVVAETSGLRLDVVALRDGSVLAVETGRTGQRFSYAGRSGRSFAGFEVAIRGPIEIAATFPSDQTNRRATLAVGRETFNRILGVVAGALAAGLAGAAGVLLAVRALRSERL